MEIIGEITERAAEVLGGYQLVTEHDLRDVITDMIERLGSQTAVARELGVSVVYLNDVLHGKRGLGMKLAEGLGWEKIEIYRRK